jgi:N-acetylmuramoyl-L-alanine amidase
MISARLLLAVALLGACDPRGGTTRDKGGKTAPTAGGSAPGPSLEPPEVLTDLVELDVPASPGRVLVAIDPGHGAPGNRGNESSFCVAEEDFTLGLAYDLEALLVELGFEVALTRRGSARTPYEARVREAERIGAAAFVSLHSDVRGHIATWSPREGVECRHAEDAPGFSVLLSDESPTPALLVRRQDLATQVAARLIEAGFTPYGGAEYESLYAPLSEAAPGVFLDRHEPDKRVFVLRRPAIPSVIVETHNALDRREAEAWETPEVRRAFGLALAAALRSL